MRRLLIVSLFLLIAPFGINAQGPEPRAPKDWYWQLGAGQYWNVGLGTELDGAMWDWLLVTYPAPESYRLLERCHQINPKQKYVMRINVPAGLGDARYYLGTATFLDYYYKPGVREKTHDQIRDVVRSTIEDFKCPDSIFAYTYSEELPGWWGCGDIIAWGKDPTQVPRELERYRKNIEAERGKPLVWDDETRLWAGKKYVESINDIHRIIKEASGGKMIIYWHHAGYDLLDTVPEGTPLTAKGLYPIRAEDIIKPGLCEGIMVGASGKSIFEKRFEPLLQKHHWPYFYQLSHPATMRLMSWADAVAVAEQKRPENLGYMFYCEGNCRRRRWNDDPAIPADDNVRSASIPTHMRRHCAQRGVGREVVRRYFRPRVQLQVSLDKRKPGDLFPVYTVVTNTRDETYYLDKEEARLHDVKVTLSLPDALAISPKHSGPATLSFGTLEALDKRLAEWWIVVKQPFKPPLDEPIRVAVEAQDAPSGSAETLVSAALPGLEKHVLRRSGEYWDEPGFGLPSDKPWVEMVPLNAPVKNPAITDGEHTWTYQGEIYVGQRLVIAPDGTARLHPQNLLPDTSKQLSDPDDPTGYRAFDKGYGVLNLWVSKYVKPGSKYRLTLEGKAEGGANSMANIRCFTFKNEVKALLVMHNLFSDKWQAVTREVEIPRNVNSLRRFYLYRYHKKGRIWYGQPRLEPADLPAEGLDVSARVAGSPLRLQHGLTRITYRDESLPTLDPKITVRLFYPE